MSDGDSVTIRDRGLELIPRLKSLAETQRRRHPGRRVTLASVLRELAEAALGDERIMERLSR